MDFEQRLERAIERGQRTGSAFAPNTKKQQVFVNLADGVYMFHVITVDQLSAAAIAQAGKFTWGKAASRAIELYRSQLI